jgi:hypothetical protein
MKWWFYIGNVLLVAVLVGCNTPPPVGHPLNSYQSKQERDEQKGFQAILEGLCNMFRNPESHQPKI